MFTTLANASRSSDPIDAGGRPGEGNDQNVARLVDPLQMACRFEAVHTGHVDVSDDDDGIEGGGGHLYLVQADRKHERSRRGHDCGE